jgi:Protein of unknown function (DUF3617)
MQRLLLLSILCILAAGAGAEDAPRRKSGLWEVSMSSPQMPTPMVSRQCVDEKTDDMGKSASRGGAEKCSKKSVRREGGNVILESVCQIEGSTATTRGVFSGDFKSSYKGEMTTRFAPPLHGAAESKMNFQARLTGPCAPGQKPGEVAVQGMPGKSASGAMSSDEARRMVEEMQRKYGKQ